ncbi:MAG TPA: hypothetical protein VF690_11890 [Hymenobacter sp.]
MLVQWQLALVSYAQPGQSTPTTIQVYPDSVLSDVSGHPLGINLDYFMDDDKYLHPQRRLADALKAMHVKYLRYPGGNKSDFYFFSRPPYQKALPTLARTGPAAVGGRNRALNPTATDFKNDVLDFDEFMALCREVGAEPVVVVAADEYLVKYPTGSTWATKEQLLTHAVEWVRYANLKKKYGVRYWMIGNESWGPENKNSNAELYAQDVVDFSKAMKAVDPAIQIVPNGNSEQWWKTVLTKAAGHIDALCLSNYPVYKLPKGFESYRDSVLNFTYPIATALRAITQYATPADQAKLKVIVAEYGPFDWGKTWPFVNNMGYCLANFELTGEQLKEPKLAFSCFWNTRWIENDSVKYSVFDALDKNGNFNANGYSLAVWGRFLGKQMVQTTSTTHLRSFASYSPAKKRLFVYLVNKSATAVPVGLQLGKYRVRSTEQVWELSGTGPDDTNPVWQRQPVPSAGSTVMVKPTSIKVLEYQLK